MPPPLRAPNVSRRGFDGWRRELFPWLGDEGGDLQASTWNARRLLCRDAALAKKKLATIGKACMVPGIIALQEVGCADAVGLEVALHGRRSGRRWRILSSLAESAGGVATVVAEGSHGEWSSSSLVPGRVLRAAWEDGAR